MIMIAWILRAFFILMPLVTIPIYVAVRGFIWPLFFGDGIAGVFRGLFAGETIGLICGFFFLLVVNVFYMRIFYFLDGAVQKFNNSMINRVDRFLDRLLGGGYGRGCSTSAGRILKRSVKFVCLALGLYCGYFLIGGVVWGDFFTHGWSSLGEEIGGRVIRWTSVIVFFMLFGNAMVYAVERLICGSFEKAGYAVSERIAQVKDGSIDMAKDDGVWRAKPKSLSSNFLADVYKNYKERQRQR